MRDTAARLAKDNTPLGPELQDEIEKQMKGFVALGGFTPVVQLRNVGL